MKALKQFCLLSGILMLFFSCKKEKSLEQGTASGPSQWEFKDSIGQFKGNMDTAYIVSAGPLSAIVLEGTSLDASLGAFHMEIFTTSLAKGTSKSPNVKFAYIVNSVVLYENVPSNTDKFSVTITNIDATSVTGVFSGEVETPIGTTRTITQGSFSAKLSSSSTQPGLPAAQLTLASAGGNCSNTKVNGTYTVGTALGAANTVEVEVNVSVAGSFNISTPVKNGIWFDAIGSVTGTGLQKITLKGNGTPTTVGANSIAIAVGTSNCDFTIDAVAGSGGGGSTPATDSWSFTQGSKTYSGTFPVGAALADHPTGIGKVLWFPGTAGTDTIFSLRVHYSTSVAKPALGTYKTQPSHANLSNMTDFSLVKQTFTSITDIFTAKTLLGTGSNVITIVITSYDDATNTVTGTFSGKAWTGSGGTVDIINGKFSAEVVP